MISVDDGKAINLCGEIVYGKGLILYIIAKLVLYILCYKTIKIHFRREQALYMFKILCPEEAIP